MQITVYSLMESEQEYYEKLKENENLTFIYTKEMPMQSNVKLAKGSDAVIVITTPITSDIIEAFAREGVKYIATRTAGYDHIDLAYAKKTGVGIGNSSYASDNVAEYTIMLMLMANRNIKTILLSYQNQDFSLKNVQGSLLGEQTVGIIGTGKIGTEVAKLLKGFGCNIIAYSRTQKEELKEILTYVSLEELYRESDVISLHLPSTEENYHMINKNAIEKMKQDVMIINTARGALIDTKALIEGLESKKIAGVALDVIEDETMYYYHNFKNMVITHQEMAILRSMPNVIMTPHTAFHTRQASMQMAQNAVRGCLAALCNQENPWKIV